jgi:hypothetical protein
MRSSAGIRRMLDSCARHGAWARKWYSAAPFTPRTIALNFGRCDIFPYSDTTVRVWAGSADVTISLDLDAEAPF